MCYKIIYRLICLNFEEFFEFDKNSVTRGHNLKLKIARCNSDSRKYFFSIKIAPVWNSLPYDLVNCRSLGTFKRNLKQQDLTMFSARKFDATCDIPSAN